jgi:carboxyl-terminal processing protease
MRSAIVGNFVFEQLDLDRNAFKGIAYDYFSKDEKSDFYFNSKKSLMQMDWIVKLVKNKEVVKDI